MYRALGFPPQFFTVLFAVPRIVGYVSHWRESLADPDVKIMRPQQDYRVRTASHYNHESSQCLLQQYCNMAVPMCGRKRFVQEAQLSSPEKYQVSGAWSRRGCGCETTRL